MAEYFRQNHITISFMTTQVGRAFALNLAEHPCPDLKIFLVGGETLVPLDPPKSVQMYNLYGPTEASVYATCFPVECKMDSIPIGKAVYNTKLYVADRWMRMMPIGAPGELLLSGYGVGRGYLGRPDLSAEAFTENVFTSEKDYERVYHTGDIVRCLADGNIEFIGRRDGQVKVRGFRVELTEVEEIIRRFPPIVDATVVAKDAPTGGKMICAYIVSNEDVDIQALNDFIAQQKPPYMVPAFTMQIESIPLNMNSKVDKRALPEPTMKVAELVAPATPMQQKIFDVLQPILGHDQFGSTTDIYEAGLTSIGAVTLNVALSEAFDTPIRIRDIKEHKTIEQLEEFLQTAEGPAAREMLADYPLSRTQEGIFVECMANPNTTMYNIPLLLKLGKGVDLKRLRDALLQTIEAHPSLKTTLFMDDSGNIRQKRNDDDTITIDIVDTLECTSLVRPFSLMGDRLFRISLHQAEDTYLFMDFHHIICDGTSLGIFINEVNRAYEGEALEQETYSGFEVALDEARLREEENYQRAHDYYRQLLQGCETEFLPAKDGQGGQPTTGNVRFSTPGARAVKEYCELHNVTMNAFFTAAFGFLVGKYVYKDEAVFATIYNGRSDSRMVNTLGMLVKTLPVYCVAKKEQTVDQYIVEVKDQLISSMENDVYSFGEVSREFGVTADILFAYQGDTFAFDWIAGQKAERVVLESNTPKEPINLDVLIEGEDVVFACEFRQDLYSSAMMDGLLEAFAQVTAEFVEKKQLGEVSLLTQRAAKLLQTFNDTEVSLEPVTANILFERQVVAHPDKTAVIANGIALTFTELNERANCVANSLIERSLETEALVGLMLGRTVDAYAVRQGIMKAGGAFLTIDPLYPEDRIEYILEDSKVPYLIVSAQTAEECKSFLATCSVQVFILEELLATNKIDNPHPSITGDNLAYSIYTSGSTGKPKGVMIRHRNLVNYVNYNPVNTEVAAYVEHAQVALAFAALTFDVSILEECIMLYNGITVCMANEDEIHNPLALSALILENHVDALTCTPSYLMNIIDLEEMAPALKQMALFNIGAESFPRSLYTKIKKLGTDALILNGYGPTETTIGCTLEFITDKKVTIGRPMANMKMVMVDPSGNTLPPGVPGEMMILGAGVGKGYIGKPELTAKTFVTFEGDPAYHSGDMARWNFEGNIEFMGRIDNQVKLRGLRIELDEVENALNSFDAVNNSAVVVRGEGEHQYLCAYYTATREVSSKELQDFMGQSLTEYMVPSRLVQMEVLPLTSNGKIDKKALPEPSTEHEQAKNFAKPRTELEATLHEVFAFALGFDNFGIDENFFDLGGTSLSVSKIAMKCMTNNLPVVYADVFKYQTVELLAQYVAGKAEGSKKEADTSVKPVQAAAVKPADTFEKPLSVAMFDVLSHNDVRYVDEVQQGDIGSLLLTGATGFLGIHVLYGYLKNYEGIAYCLVKGTQNIDAFDRLKSLFFYYFDGDLIDLFEQRVSIVEGDITDEHLISQ
ncbi:MAG: amino acid adenylation domain-containing protein, partial [Raoultibacter sp.]